MVVVGGGSPLDGGGAVCDGVCDAGVEVGVALAGSVVSEAGGCRELVMVLDSVDRCYIV